MASASALQTPLMTKSSTEPASGNRTCLQTTILYPSPVRTTYFGSKLSFSKTNRKHGTKRKNSSLTVVAAFGDVSSDGTNYLIAGAIAVALLGTAFPILFSRKDLCPECDGAGFVRKTGVTLRANAARKDQAQIVCPRCNGLGKLNQIDK